MRILASFVALLVLSTTVFAAERPNIVVIYTDDQGYGDAGCLNPQAKFQTPHIDRLAREGISFTDGHCADTVCTPSRYGLLTGRYCWRTRLKSGVLRAEGKGLIPDDRLTLASLLKNRGYRTAMVGKWHLHMDFPGKKGNRNWNQPVQDMPLDKGFDYFFGIPASMNYGVLAWFEGRYADVPPTLYTRKKPNKIALSDYRIAPPYDEEPQHPRDLEVAPDFVDVEALSRFTDKAVDWIESAANEARQGHPFFLYLPYTSPHKPVIPVEKFRGKSRAGAYGDFMMETDAHIGRILDVLDRERLTKNTFVFFSSDNGPENTWRKRIKLYDHHSSGPYRGGKRSIYEGGHRVPFIIRWPAQVEAGRTWDQPVCQTDLLATLAEILEIRLPEDAGEDSVSFYPVLIGEESVSSRPPLVHHSMRGRFAVREGKWKLVMERGKSGRELYDLHTDRSETNNVASQHPQIVKELTQKLTRIVKNGRSTPGKPQSNDGASWWPDLTWIKKPEGN